MTNIQRRLQREVQQVGVAGAELLEPVLEAALEAHQRIAARRLRMGIVAAVSP